MFNRGNVQNLCGNVTAIKRHRVLMSWACIGCRRNTSHILNCQFDSASERKQVGMVAPSS